MITLQRSLVRVSAAAVAVIGWGAVLVAPMGASAAIINSTVHGEVIDSVLQDGTGDSFNNTFVEVRDAGVGSLQERGVIEFDISSLTTPTTSAVLKLTQSVSNLIGSRTFQVSGYTGNGTLENADYSPPGASVIGTFEHFNEATEEFDVTAFINAQIALDDPLHFAGFIILWADAPETKFVIFGSSAATYPTLEVTPVPLPAALPLFLSALAGLGLMGWRRRQAVA